MTDRKPILCLDFDGVIHAYTSGWKGVTRIPDPPVPGALQFIVAALDRFQVAIYSSRSRTWFGRQAMRAWLLKHLIDLSPNTPQEAPDWWYRRVARTAFADPWSEEVIWAAKNVCREILWAKHKPPATVSIDDRALLFDGTFPSLDMLASFQPLTKRFVGVDHGSDDLTCMVTADRDEIGTIGHVDHGKTTLAAALTKVGMQQPPAWEDRNLIELAAKVAGYESEGYEDGGWLVMRYGLHTALWIPAIERYWNPLEDDGDALRLAVMLNLSFESSPTEELHGTDRYAATRKAIVMAAVAMAEDC